MTPDPFRHDPGHWYWSAAAVAAFVLLCLMTLKRPKTGAITGLDYLVLYASQTGQAEEIARASTARLSAGGLAAQALSLAVVNVDMLRNARHILCVVSTTGEGDAPDEALGFQRHIMTANPDLSSQSFAVLALGDRTYDHFCAFGHRLDAWLTACGAQALRPCLEIDDLAPEALAQWDAFLIQSGAASATDDTPYRPWVLQSRDRMDAPMDTVPGLFRLHLTAQDTRLMNWQAGDLAEIITPDSHRRDYSIASLPSEGSLMLFVREVIKNNGDHGRGSGLLTQDLAIGGTVMLRLKLHKGFHAPPGTGPLLLIGAGSGLAGLRPHIVAATRPCLLIYGTRHRHTDTILCDTLEDWQRQGKLKALDLAISQPDTGDGRYVQDVVAQDADAIRHALQNDGAVMVCGGLAMGRAVEQVIANIMGRDWVDEALSDGRYRHDLY